MSQARTIAVFLVVGVAVAVFFYKLGQRTADPVPTSGVARGVGSDVNASTESDSAATESAAPAKLQITEGGSSTGFQHQGAIAHFEIGNRNVKALFAEGEVIWLGTSGGVIRYDGKTDQYKVYDNKTPGILSNGIFHISKIQDRIFVGSYGGGLSVLDPQAGTWRNFNIPDGLADQFVYDVEQGPNGDIWIATWSGVNRIRGGNLDDRTRWDTFTVESTQSGLPNPWVYGVEVGSNGDVWFATEAGLARFRDGQWKNWQHKDGLGAPLEVVKDAIQFTNDPAKASKHHAQQKAEQGLGEVDVAYNPNYIISLEVDEDGVVWCGTWGGGLARFDGERWTNYSTAQGLPGNHIFMLHRDQTGNLWVGTSKGLSRFDRRSGQVNTLTVADGLYADNVFSMTHAADGAVWVGSFGGVARIAAGGWRG